MKIKKFDNIENEEPKEENSGIKDNTFNFLMELMGYRNQLRMNHWQTKSYSEHKLTDDILGKLDGHIDTIGEAALGIFERPSVKTFTNEINDIKDVSTKTILNNIDNITDKLLEEYKEENMESMISLLGDFSADIKKYKYLSTLE